jgi:hypothetical protein
MMTVYTPQNRFYAGVDVHARTISVYVLTTGATPRAKLGPSWTRYPSFDLGSGEVSSDEPTSKKKKCGSGQKDEVGPARGATTAKSHPQVESQ